jgi:hypothetical protein
LNTKKSEIQEEYPKILSFTDLYLIIFTISEITSKYNLQEFSHKLTMSSEEGEDEVIEEVPKFEAQDVKSVDLGKAKTRLVHLAHQLSMSNILSRTVAAVSTKGSHYLLVIHGKSGFGKVCRILYVLMSSNVNMYRLQSWQKLHSMQGLMLVRKAL